MATTETITTTAQELTEAMGETPGAWGLSPTDTVLVLPDGTCDAETSHRGTSMVITNVDAHASPERRATIRAAVERGR